ncbi:MAG: hypothetical protein IKY21_02385 [Clostridia bacterium]|nr:hypothetical protein [Clostridia bacterium]
MKKNILLLLTAILLIVFCSCDKGDIIESRLSHTCDQILCEGYDDDGNQYELVANQKETSLGYEITVGVIKNNEWLYPLSTEFPFLGEDGLFHVSCPMGSKSGSNLSQHTEIRKAIRFIDNGTFVMDSYNNRNTTGWKLYNHYYIFFSCANLKSLTIDCDKSTLIFRKSNYHTRDIITDNGNIIMYTETSDTISGWLEDKVFDWQLLNTKTLQVSKIASRVSGVCPEGAVSENLFFASDKHFYNTNAQKVINLSEYNIDMFSGSNIYFENGKCNFEAKNKLGTNFSITIDKSGNVIEEVQK